MPLERCHDEKIDAHFGPSVRIYTKSWPQNPWNRSKTRVNITPDRTNECAYIAYGWPLPSSPRSLPSWCQKCDSLCLPDCINVPWIDISQISDRLPRYIIVRCTHWNRSWILNTEQFWRPCSFGRKFCTKFLVSRKERSARKFCHSDAQILRSWFLFSCIVK